MEPFETFEYQHCTIELHCDETPTSPADWDTLGTLVMDTDHYTFADRSMTSEERDAIERGGAALLVRYLRMSEGVYAWPLHFQDYGSSGARLFAGDLSDDEPNGYIYTTVDRLRELCGEGDEYLTAEWIEKALRGELLTWGQYVEGEVIGYVVKSRGEIVDSVWGFYPDTSDGSRDGLEYVRKEARSAAIEEHRAQVAAEKAGIPTVA